MRRPTNQTRVIVSVKQSRVCGSNIEAEYGFRGSRSLLSFMQHPCMSQVGATNCICQASRCFDSSAEWGGHETQDVFSYPLQSTWLALAFFGRGGSLLNEAINIIVQLNARLSKAYALHPCVMDQAHFKSQTYGFAGEYARRLSPRHLVFLRDDEAFVGPDHSDENQSDVPHPFISYTREHFNPNNRETCGPLYQVADRMTREAGLEAYWLDHLCITTRKRRWSSQMTSTASLMRLVVLDNLLWLCQTFDLQRLLPGAGACGRCREALLCQNGLIKFSNAFRQADWEIEDRPYWRGLGGGDQTGRLLAENFSGSLSLGRLELINKGLEALSCRVTERF